MALELGPCGITYNSASIGKTFGGVTVKISDDSVDLKSDQYGTSPEDTVITGTSCEVELSIAELGFDNIATALGQSAFGSTSNRKGIAGVSKVGSSLLTAAKELKLTKYVSGAASTAAADEIVFPKAAPVSNVELSFDAENQRVMKVTFKCFPSAVAANWGATSTSSKTVLYYFGDEAATA